MPGWLVELKVTSTSTALGDNVCFGSLWFFQSYNPYTSFQLFLAEYDVLLQGYSKLFASCAVRMSHVMNLTSNEIFSHAGTLQIRYSARTRIFVVTPPNISLYMRQVNDKIADTKQDYAPFFSRILNNLAEWAAQGTRGRKDHLTSIIKEGQPEITLTTLFQNCSKFFSLPKRLCWHNKHTLNVSNDCTM